MSLESESAHNQEGQAGSPPGLLEPLPPGNSQHRSLVLEAIGWVGHDLATEQEQGVHLH